MKGTLSMVRKLNALRNKLRAFVYFSIRPPSALTTRSMRLLNLETAFLTSASGCQSRIFIFLNDTINCPNIVRRNDFIDCRTRMTSKVQFNNGLSTCLLHDLARSRVRPRSVHALVTRWILILLRKWLYHQLKITAGYRNSNFES